ncbi:MAG: helix-turn-helix domain-containing protein [Christensenellales bacterium]|jgi:DNA-binding Xre family transcriptional regulator
MAGAKTIKQLMIERNITVKDLADAIGIIPQSMSNKLYRDNFGADELVKIAKILDCKIVAETNDSKKQFIIDINE